MARAPESSRSLLHILGTGGAMAGLAWVLWQLFGQGWSPPSGFEGRRMLVTLALGASLYSLLSLWIAGAWWWLTGVYGDRQALSASVAVWARTQIAKYLPGNVFHYVGRQALGRHLGLSHETLAASHLLEAASLFAAAALIGVGGALITRSPAAAAVSLPWVIAAGVGALLAWPLADAALRRSRFTAERMARLPRLTLTDTLRLLFPAIVSHAMFLGGTSLVLLFLSRATRSSDLGPADVLWVYALAWIAGTLTPGAPGGLGIRESVLTLGLETALGAGNAAALALALRFVTLLGDALTYGVGMLIPIPGQEPNPIRSPPLKKGG